MQDRSSLEQIIARLDAIEARLATVTTEPGLLSRPDAARWLGVSPRTLDSIIYGGQLPTRVIGQRRLVPLAALREYARRDHPEPTSALRSGRRAGVAE
ncbi:MAG TPA: helix-turn-helix domain-containing protein [Terriglobales bacterium]|nr:helix-turn-helix domain-containing protein [Terriglobales bacterium]